MQPRNYQSGLWYSYPSEKYESQLNCATTRVFAQWLQDLATPRAAEVPLVVFNDVPHNLELCQGELLRMVNDW